VPSAGYGTRRVPTTPQIRKLFFGRSYAVYARRGGTVSTLAAVASLRVPEAKLRGGRRLLDPFEEHPPYLDENVQFSVFRPKVVQPEDWYDLLAAAHLEEKRPGAPEEEPEPIEKVRRRVAQILGAQVREYKETTQDSTQAVPRGGEITFVPEMENVEFNPPRQTILWVEDEYVVPFRFCASAELDGTTARGRMSVFLGAILLADVPLKFEVSSSAAGPAESPPEQRETARPYRKIFASYSHQDLVIVEQFERYAEALGDEYLRDWRTLRAGEVWNDRLMQMIDEADVFQLFWSRNSMNSAYVRREWEYALASGRRKFIRPVYWEEPLPQRPPDLPPEELARLHFQRLGVGIVGPASVVPEEERVTGEPPAPSFRPRGRPGAPTLPPAPPAKATDAQGIEPAESTSPSGMEPEAQPPLWEPTRRTSASVIRPEREVTDKHGIEPEQELLAEDAEIADGSGMEPADDDFLLTPLDEGADDEDSESGSQVIALDEAMGEESPTMVAGGAGDGMVAMLDEEGGADAGVAFGASQPTAARAALAPEAGEYYPEIKRKRLLLGTLVLLAPVAIVSLILGLLWWQSAKVTPHVGNVEQMIEEERLDDARQYLDDLAGRSPGLSRRREIRELRSRLDRLLSMEEDRRVAFAKCLERARDASTSQAVSDALAAARRLAKTDAERADVDRLEQQLKE
ncbi:MAG TPA: toll/interleukin-1 receptor domain-containing protein, partial [Thermoguttaceae bacterium]|nr:toll/interleukin-1 receptor domain-containing protein [Thermoguttaceae bacterium]